ncbi:hypothetical protein SAMN04489806_3244 [Paramicrobacterium humi]|uniref:DUF2798 domain-containing protein n=1 Tax=Paramicrobacterium humi TaxID=640635 RepID=A0A1H4TLJ3_9MICO|nr:hypothetical protein [Microbacterium humi]SEC57110.1 hypothetical protein SAMN04489806_3244 [Microbacterium humi]
MSDHHKFGTHLPRSGRESLLFVLVISLISVNIIPVVISGLTIGFTLDMWLGVLRVLPLLWIVVVAVVMLTRKPAMWLTGLVVRKGDSFRAHIFADTLCSVLLISIILTVVGAWIGTWSFATDPVVHFFENWPRNFMIAFVIEALLAQPVARLVMRGHHRRVDRRGGGTVRTA